MGVLRRRRPEQAVLVTRQGCTLCSAAEPLVAREAAAAGVPLRVVDVDRDADEAQRAAWTDKVPVVLLDGVEHAYWTVDERALRAALRGRR